MLGSCSAKGCLSRSFTSLSPSPKCLARFHIWNARSRLATQTDDQLKHGKVPPEWCSVLYYYQMNLLDFCSFYCRAFLLFFFCTVNLPASVHPFIQSDSFRFPCLGFWSSLLRCFFLFFICACFLLVNIAYLIICLCIYTKNKTTQIQLVHILIQDRDAIAHFCCGIVVFVKKLLVKLL